MFTPIQKILPKSIVKLGFTRETQAALVCERYRKLAPSIIHPEILIYTYPKFFRGSTLTIGVENSAWAAQVINNKETLIKVINKSIGKPVINILKTQISVKRVDEDQTLS